MEPYPDREAATRAFARHVAPGKAALYERMGLDLILGAREGVRIRDAYGDRTWLDCHTNGGVFGLGHRNPSIIAAVTEALANVDIGNHHLVSGHRAHLAERLAATTGGRLSGVVFGVSGGESVDLAIKAARAATGRRKVVSARGGFHGHTGLALAAGDPHYRDPFGPNLPGFAQVPFGDPDAMAAAVDEDTAAVILEPIPATLGMPIPPPGYLEQVQALCRDRGALFVLDEVQTGLGRCGAMWCHQTEALAPDIIVTGKGLSGGIYPITAAVMTREVHAVFDDRPFAHVSTFGGAEPGCAAALAVLDIVEAPGFLGRVRALAVRFADGLAGGGFALRQRGLMMALAFDQDGAGMLAAKLLYDAGVFAAYANNDRRVVQLLPPLTISDDEADEIIARIRGALR